MKHDRLPGRAWLLLSLGLSALPALAGDDCDAPVARWQSREAVRRMATDRGWQLQRLRIKDGCFELRGTDTQGRAFKARIDPETLAVRKLKQRDSGPDRRQNRRGDPDPVRQGSTSKRPATAPTNAFTPGSVSRSPAE